MHFLSGSKSHWFSCRNAHSGSDCKSVPWEPRPLWFLCIFCYLPTKLQRANGRMAKHFAFGGLSADNQGSSWHAWAKLVGFSKGNWGQERGRGKKTGTRRTCSSNRKIWATESRVGNQLLQCFLECFSKEKLKGNECRLQKWFVKCAILGIWNKRKIKFSPKILSQELPLLQKRNDSETELCPTGLQ